MRTAWVIISMNEGIWSAYGVRLTAYGLRRTAITLFKVVGLGLKKVMGDFQKLLVCRESADFTKAIYALIDSTDLKMDFGLKDQLQRASVSISSHIAEGDELSTDKQSKRHFYIAKGSSAEVRSLLILCKEMNKIESDIANSLIDHSSKISAMLSLLIKARAKII